MNRLVLPKNHLFNLWYTLELNLLSQRSSIILTAGYLIMYILQIMSLKDMTVIALPITLKFTGFIVILILLLIIIIQALVFIIAERHFYLQTQAKIYRYLLFPTILRYIINQITQANDLSFTTALILGIIIMLIGGLISLFLSFESYHSKTIVFTYFPFSFYLFLYQLCLITFQFATIHLFKSFILLIFLGVAILAFNLEKHIIATGFELFFIVFINRLNLVTIAYLFMHQLQDSIPSSFAFFVIQWVLYAAIGVFLYFKRVTHLEQALKLFQEDNDQIGDLQLFIASSQLVVSQSQDVIDGHQKANATEVMAFLHAHQQNCHLSFCPLLGEQAKVEFKSLSEMKSLRNLLIKLKKHLQLIFQQRRVMSNQNLDLALAYLHFLTHYSAHKRKAEELHLILNHESHGWRIDYFLFKIKKKVEQLEDDESFLQHKSAKTQLQLFTNSILANVESLSSICRILFQQQIDFSLLTNAAQQLSMTRQRLETYVQTFFPHQTFAAYRILSLYTLCCRQVFLQQNRANEIQTHLVALMEQLDYKKQIQFLSTRSQIGLLAISLSQSSLGNIVSVNQTAESIFGFQSRELYSRTVNKIMPDVFAGYHDSLLAVFLRNRYKKVNGDERVLVGKNKNGFIFPLMLRLQRTVVSADQLMFVANIRRYKTRQSPLMCIVDPEGEIIDFSAGFQFYFMKKIKQRGHFRKRNIYEITPALDQIGLDQPTITLSTEYEPCKQVTANFNVSPLAFFGSTEAYLLIGSKVKDIARSNSCFSLPPLTKHFQTTILQQEIRCHYNSYNYMQGHYLVQSYSRVVLNSDLKNRQFTIPYIHIEQISNILQLQEEELKSYSKNIRTLRLCNKHLEPVDFDITFITEQSDLESTHLITNKHQIMASPQKKSNNFLTSLKAVLILFMLAIAVLSIALIFSTNYMITSNNIKLQQDLFNFEVKNYFADFVIFCEAIQLQTMEQFYANNFGQVQARLIKAIQNAPLQQFKKQDLLRIVYMKNSKILQQLLNSQLLRYDIIHGNWIYPVVLWFVCLGLFLLMSGTLIWIYVSFKKRLYQIYSYFLSIEQDVVQVLFRECDRFKKIMEGKQIIDKEEDQRKNIILADNDDNNQKNQNNQLRKFKSFTNIARKHDLKYTLQFSAIILIIMVVIIAAIANFYSQNQKLKKIQIIYTQISELLPQSSLFLMNSLLYYNNSGLSIGDSFISKLQVIDQHLIQYSQSYGNSDFKTIIDVFSTGDVCSSSLAITVNSSACYQFDYGILGRGISVAYNHMITTTLALNNDSKNSSNLPILDQLIQLQYQFIEPIVNQLILLINEIKNSEESLFIRIHSGIVGILLASLLFSYIFLITFPFRRMDEELNLTRKIIQLLQKLREKKRQSDRQLQLELRRSSSE